MEHWQGILVNKQYLEGYEKQPEPKRGKEVVLRHVLNDLVARAEVGFGRYGTYLKTHNGRDSLVDAYEEALDLCMYLKQKIMEDQDLTKG